MVPTCYATAQWPAGRLERCTPGPRFCRCDVTDLKLIWGDELAASFATCSATCILNRFLSAKYFLSFAWFHLKHVFFHCVLSPQKKTAGLKLDALEPSATKGVRCVENALWGLVQTLEGGCPVRNFKQLHHREFQRFLCFFWLRGPWIFEIFALVLPQFNSPLQVT